MSNIGPTRIGPDPLSYTYGYTLSSSNPIGQFGFQHGSNLYEFLTQGNNTGDYSIHAFTSTDGASWSELDDLHRPNGGNAFLYGTVTTIAVDGSTAWVMQVFASTDTGTQVVTVTGIQVTSFDLTTGTWGSSTSYATVIPGFVRGNHVVVKLIVRGPGDMILYYSGVRETIGFQKYSRCFYATFNGSSFGTPTEFPGQAGVTSSFIPISGIADSAGRVHFLFYSGSTTSHRAMDSSGTFGVEQPMSWFTEIGGGDVSEPVLYTESGTEKIAFAAFANVSDAPTVRLVLAHADATLEPSWGVSLISGDPEVPTVQGFDLIPQSVAIAYNNGMMYVTYTWWDQSSFDPPATRQNNPYTVYRETKAPVSTFAWTTPVTLWSPPIDSSAFGSGSNPYSGAWCAYQLNMFSGSLGIGLIGISDDDQGYSVAEFYLIDTSGDSGGGTTPPASLCIIFDTIGKLTLVPSPTRPISIVA